MWPLRRRFYFSAEQKRNQLPRRESRIRTTFHITPGSKMKRISRGPAECSKRSPNQINHGCPRNRGVRVQDQRTSTGRHATSLSRRASLCVKAYRNIPEEDSITPRRAQDLITGKGTAGTPPLLSDPKLGLYISHKGYLPPKGAATKTYLQN